MKNVFGKENVINSGTFQTEGTKSAVISGYKGIGLTMNDAQNALGLLPDGYSLKDAFFGNEKNGTKPADKFIEDVNQHEGLQEVLLSIEGLVSGRGSHASGVFVMPDGYVNHFGAMKTSSGLTITQFEAKDVEAVGGIKIDFLSIDALDRIRESMDILLENKKIEWQGDIKSTFDKYLHPDVIDLANPDLYKAINSGTIPHIFQFATNTGAQGIRKVQPQNFAQLGATNSLIRMTTTGEQLIDKYIRFRDNPGSWDEEMIENGLSDEERTVLHNQLDGTFGINDTQEKLMEIVMDGNISNFTLGMANKMRKAVAKKSVKLQELQEGIFFKNGTENGVSQEMLNYVWNFLIVPQFGYAFSSPHVSGYSLIAIIEAHIAVQFGDIYWKTANLNVDAGTTHGFDLDSISYPDVAKGVQNARQTAKIDLPSVNRALATFEISGHDTIQYPVGAVSSVNQDLIERIKSNQPYSQVMEFYSKVEPTDKQMSLLIKSGAFHEFVSDNFELAKLWVKATTPRKSKLTTIQLPRLMGDLPVKYKDIAQMYRVKSALWGRNAIKMNPELEKFYLANYPNINYSYVDGVLTVDQKAFDKEFNKISKPLKEWLKTDEAIDVIHNQDMGERWNKLFQGNTNAWAFEALSFYPEDHELSSTPMSESFASFSNLPEIPKKGSNGRPLYEKVLIAGTVLSYNSAKGTAQLYTTDGAVITLGVGKGRASYYAKRVSRGKGKNRHVIDGSWFQRNNKLAAVGYRREDRFQVNNNNTYYDHGIMQIHGYDDYATIQNEKMKE